MGWHLLLSGCVDFPLLSVFFASTKMSPPLKWLGMHNAMLDWSWSIVVNKGSELSFNPTKMREITSRIVQGWDCVHKFKNRFRCRLRPEAAIGRWVGVFDAGSRVLVILRRKLLGWIDRCCCPGLYQPSAAATTHCDRHHQWLLQIFRGVAYCRDQELHSGHCVLE